MISLKFRGFGDNRSNLIERLDGMSAILDYTKLMSSMGQTLSNWVFAKPHRFPVIAASIGIVFPIIGAILLVESKLHENGTLLILICAAVAASIAIPAGLANYHQAKFTEKQRKALNEAATTDPLTGSLNRRSFYAAVRKEQAAMPSQDKTSYLVLFDLDHFKSVNDTYGHQVGDTVLVAVADTARAHIRSGTDHLARWGGEEFAVFLSDADAEIAMAFAERLRKSFEILDLGDALGPLRVTASFGLSPMTTDLDLDDALKAADRALYSAKRAGRNQSIAATGARVIAAA